MIHAYASQANYWRHLAPIVDELRARGHDVATWAKRASQPWGERIRLAPPGDLTVVASEADASLVAPHPIVYVEHGAGQTYTGRVDRRGYAGGPGLAHARLFIAPGEHVAQRWRATYPDADVAVVGCPALDVHVRSSSPDGPRSFRRGVDHRVAPGSRQGAWHDGGSLHRPAVVALTAHWRSGLCTETMPATPMFAKAIRVLVEAGEHRVVGHAHPRDGDATRTLWGQIGIPFEVDPDVILATADLLVADNTSLMYEAAALDIPVLALNSPRYRRHVEHGLRFWSHVPGIQCDTLSTFLPAVVAALDDPPEARELRRRAAEHVYARRDGTSTAAAVDAIERVI